MLHITDNTLISTYLINCTYYYIVLDFIKRIVLRNIKYTEFHINANKIFGYNFLLNKTNSKNNINALFILILIYKIITNQKI